ncbi:MAG TPA: methyltransferase domain-containing protein [Puia sp.]|nr:methyltransferase domain-containing protein [Puia sp.]
MNVHCPLCYHESYTVVYKDVPQCPDVDIVRCSNCGHQYTLLKKDIDMDNLYADEVYKVVENRDSIFDKILNREYRGVIGKLNTLRGRKGTLLDFGSGKGKFGSLAKEDGWQVKGVETSPERAAYSRSVYGLEIHTGFYNGGNIFHEYFDVLTLFHVLEHLPDPKPLLTELIKNNIREDGLVVIEVPNINSLQSRIIKDKWIHLDVPRHVNHFTPGRLELFLREIGLEPLKKTFYSFHLGVLGMVDTFLKLLGYKGNIIYELKNKKSKTLLVKIALLLPFAILLEWIASAMGRGSVIRMILRRKTGSGG